MDFMNREQFLEELSLIKEDLDLIKSSREKSLKFRASDYALRAFERLERLERIILNPPHSKCPCCDGTGRIYSNSPN